MNYFKNLSIYLVGSLILQSIGVISTPIFTRILSTSEFGQFLVFKSILNVSSLIITLRISSSIPNAKLDYQENEFRKYISDLYSLTVIIALCFGSVIYLNRFPISELLGIESKLIGHLVIQSYGMDLATTYLIYTIQTLQPRQHLIFSVIVSTASVVIGLISTIWMFDDKFYGRVVGLSIVYLAVIVFIIFRYISFEVLNRQTLKNWKYAIVIGSPFVFHLIGNRIISQSDRFVLNYFLGPEQTASYGLAYTVASLGLIVSEVVDKVWSPWYLKRSQNGDKETMNTVTLYYTVLVALLFSIILIASPELSMVIGPTEYNIDINVILIILLGIFFQFLTRFSVLYERFRKKVLYIPISTLIVSIINVLLNIYFIKVIGALGAAVSTLVCYILLFCFHEIVSRLHIKDYNIKFTAYIPSIFILLSFVLLMPISIHYGYNWIRIFCASTIFGLFIFLFFNMKKVFSLKF